MNSEEIYDSECEAQFDQAADICLDGILQVFKIHYPNEYERFKVAHEAVITNDDLAEETKNEVVLHNFIKCIKGPMSEVMGSVLLKAVIKYEY